MDFWLHLLLANASFNRHDQQHTPSCDAQWDGNHDDQNNENDPEPPAWRAGHRFWNRDRFCCPGTVGTPKQHHHGNHGYASKQHQPCNDSQNCQFCQPDRWKALHI
jgi:hypothetical protein